MAFSIRKMKDTDAIKVCELAHQLGYSLDAGQFLGRLLMLNQNENHSLWVLDSPETGVVGFANFEKAIGLVHVPRLEVKSLVVDKKVRGQGLGKRLMKYAESFARTENLDQVFLTTNVSRDEAHAFYEKQGYLKKKTSHAYVKDLST